MSRNPRRIRHPRHSWMFWQKPWPGGWWWFLKRPGKVDRL